MARHALSRPSGVAVQRSPPPTHETWYPGCFTGTLTLELVTVGDAYVSPSTGRLALVSDKGGEAVALAGARLVGQPVIPGSGIKGAVRMVYELLSGSCNPFSGSCRVPPQRESRPHQPFQVCDTCSLFGCLGWTGRVSFGDAVPASAGAVQVKVEKVPMGWTPDPDKTKGDFRFYDRRKAAPPRAAGGTAPLPLQRVTREVYRGTFQGPLHFVNLRPEELGRLLLAVGLAPGAESRFDLRLGGVKYDGQGAVRVAVEGLSLVFPEARRESRDSCVPTCDGWLTAATESSWAKQYWTTLEQLAAVLGGPEGG